MPTKTKEKKKYSKTKAHQSYFTARNVRVPGVTTVINQLGWNKNMLIAWARKVGMSGEDPNKIRDQAADVGTLAHFLIECHFKNIEADITNFSPEDVDKAENCALAFFEWEKSYGLKCVHSELQMVSEKYMYGGTIDFVARPTVNGHDNELWLLDFKSSKGIYDESIIQVSAYAHLWAENHKEKLDSVRIIKLGKEDGSFEDHALSVDKMRVSWDIFKHCRELYSLQKQMKG